jgi:hypothetical protein
VSSTARKAPAPRKPPPMPAPAGRSPSSGGAPLPKPVASAISGSLGVDVSPVRVHTDTTAVNANQAFSSRAFAHGSDVFLGRGERPTDLPLMAHEVTHVVQQQGAPRVQLFTSGGSDPHEREARHASAAVVSGTPFTVREQSRPRVQRLGISDVLDYFADKANNIPGFRMFTIVLGVNPINMSSVDRSAANILRAVVELLPGGHLITEALDKYGVFDKVGNWIEQQIKSLGMTGAMFKKAIGDFLDSLGWRDIFHLGSVWDRAKRIFTEPIGRLIDFGKSLVAGIIKFIKDAILMPLAKLAQGTRGWDLLIAVLGTNPITGEAVPRTANTLIPGFLKLIGQEEIWVNMQKSNAIARAWAWFQGALSGLLGFVMQIPGLFISALKSLEIMDIVVLPRAFVKVATVFGNFIVKFISWAGGMIWNLLEIIFQVVSPRAWGYIQKTGAALKSILKNPLPFVGNLVKAAKLGFQNFASNFGEHLKAGLIDWLTGSLPGVYIPKGFTLSEIVKFVLSVLGISWANVRQKLVKVVGEPAVKAMETGFSIVVTLVRDGPAAAWEQIKEALGNLKDMVIGGITDFIVDAVVKKAIPKLIAMFIPGAGFISAIISIYDTVMVFVEKISKIIQVVTGFIDSIVSIAAGVITAAAKRVESTLAGLLSLAISFVAGFIGLGRVADKIMGVINKVRAPIDKGFDALINWIVTMAKKLFAKVFGKKDEKGKPDERTDAQKQGDLDKAIMEAETLMEATGAEVPDVQSKLPAIAAKYRLTELNLVKDGEVDYHVEGAVNPKKKSKKEKLGARYMVGAHTVKAPSGLKGGDSHHVPVKVMKAWFGDVLLDASKQAENPELRKRLRDLSNKCKGKAEGAGLSAIWLSEKDHVTVHGTKPDMKVAVVMTKAGEVATKPMRSTIRGSVPTPYELVGRKEQNPDTVQLKKTFKTVFNSLVEVGLATVGGLKLKGPWKSDLKAKASETWSEYMDVPDK